jgi:hypothetical protein
MTDIQYIDGGMFTTFVPCSKAGEKVWNEMAAQNDGVAKIFSIHTKSVIAQFRAAGYTVSKAKPLKVDDDALFNELFA